MPAKIIPSIITGNSSQSDYDLAGQEISAFVIHWSKSLILLLFTATYPSSSTAEQNFLNDEMQHLSMAFERVVIVPRKYMEPLLSVPVNVNVVREYCSFLQNPWNKVLAILQVFVSPLFYRDLLTHPWLLCHPRSLGRLIAFLGGAFLTKWWVAGWLAENQINVRDCIFYTYWFDQGAMGIGLVKHLHPDLKLVSRAHGYDLYDETFRPPYWPCRQTAVSLVDRIFTASEAGAEYLRQRHPSFSSKIEVSLLGIKDPGFVSFASRDGVLRIMSCSIIRPVKRVDLLLEGVLHMARVRTDQRIEWHHHGNGDARLDLQRRADAEFPPNARAILHNYTTPKALLDFYREHPIDVFMNVSVSEGTPVSSMEAISCGVPVIATSVGGNREIVSEQNGLLLNADPSPQEIAESLFRFMDDAPARQLMREGSRRLWDRKYNADKNFQTFIESIMSVQEYAQTVLEP